MRHQNRFACICILAALVWGIAILMTFAALKQQYQAGAAGLAKVTEQAEAYVEAKDGAHEEKAQSATEAAQAVLSQTEVTTYEESVVIGDELEVVIGVPDGMSDDGSWFGN